MSHAYGAVRFERDGLVLRFEYNGTVDVCIPRLYATCEEVEVNWRSQNESLWKPCTHTTREPVLIASDYGFGFWWKGTACRECPRIIEGLSPFEDEVEISRPMPTWAKQQRRR